MLECDYCGCYSTGPGEGWVAYPGNDTATLDEPGVLVYCPQCAAAVFGHRPDLAAKYVCMWEPVPSDARNSGPDDI